MTRAAEDEVVDLLGDLTDWLLGSSFEGTMRCEAVVRDIAARYGHSVEVTFLADSAIVTVGGRTRSYAREPGVPPLHQVSEFKRLVADIHRRPVPPAEASRRLAAIRAMPPRWSKPWQVAGLVCFTVGFGISVQATSQQVAVSALTGLLVGLLVVAGGTHRRVVLVSPFLASLVVTGIVLTLAEHGFIEGGPIQLIVPALFYFIPGDAISAAALELATNRMTAGAARLVYSVVVLLVLAFGALVAAVLLRAPASDLFDTTVPGNLGPLLVWGGWVLFAIGVMLTFSMAPRDFPWALGLVLLTAGVTELGTRAFGDPAGTFFGAIAMTLAALLLGRRPGLPPAYVLYLGAFYVLTPGSHGLRGLESWIGGDEVGGVTGVADMVGLLIAIAVGMVVAAASLSRDEVRSSARADDAGRSSTRREEAA
ncbi:threonine/serine exporter family protein [Actinoplanes sp. Pm04-4]|uniref:Threonine/serine exporter family protein n=1 Tax=Paractinoplanes pyxinae TaxID=2997416 RepID=A0ABT4ARM8_9ACTN|nr:threonine/serine exporter family protein [Actinoplanes pyxinae]MCY1136879.1 threonine/serine exporter family protein [Actinoplanes pyxinae]